MKVVRLIQGDITIQKVDAIINAANTSLLGGGGVDGAIHRKGGKEILAQCEQIRAKQGSCAVGEAVMTTGGLLASRFVIHTVGPTWQNGQYREAELLQNAYLNSLKLAEQQQLQTLAFPNISTGIYRFPKYNAADIAISNSVEFLQNSKFVKEINFVCFDIENFKIYRQRLAQFEMTDVQILGI